MNAGTVLATAVALAAGSAWADQKVERSAEVSNHGYDSSASSGAHERVESSGAYERAQSFGAHERAEPSIKESGAESHTYSYASASADDKTATKSSGGSSPKSAVSSSRSRPSSSSSSSSSSARSSSARSRSERSSPPQTAAQRRHPRPGTGTGRFDFGGRNYRGPRYGWGSSYYGYGRYGYYYDPYSYGYSSYGYSPFYYSGYYGYSPSYYGRGRGYGGYYRDSGSLRIIVEPENTRVYVDGYYAGVVDDFDGILQRLRVPPGRHDITLKLEGYRTQHFKVYVPYDDTIKIHYDMVRGTGEASSEEFAGPPEDYARVRDMDDESRRRGDDDRYRDGDDRYRGDGRYESRDAGDAADAGTVRLSIRPGDASVYVDGEFRGSGRQTANIRLRPGRHRIEVVRPGYRTIEREVEVERGRNTEIEFELERM